MSPYHQTDVLYQYVARGYKRVSKLNKGAKMEDGTTDDFNIHDYNNLRDFHERTLKWKFPNSNLTPVCYGGTFALHASRLMSLSKQENEM